MPGSQAGGSGTHRDTAEAVKASKPPLETVHSALVRNHQCIVALQGEQPVGGEPQ